MLKSIIIMHCYALTCCFRTTGSLLHFARPTGVKFQNSGLNNQYWNVRKRSSVITFLLDENASDLLFRGSQPSFFSTLTRTSIRKMKKEKLKMELSFRGLNIDGKRTDLVTRLLSALDDDEEKDVHKGKENTLSIDPEKLYVLRVKGFTSRTEHGAGIGLALYIPGGEKELWTGRFYLNADRTFFEAEYSAIIMGVKYVCQVFGVQQLHVQASSDVVVHQINGLYKVNKKPLKALLGEVQHLQMTLSNFSIEEISSSENEKSQKLAMKALAEKCSLNVEDLNIDDPLECGEGQEEALIESVKIDEEKTSGPSFDSSRIYLLRFDGGSRGNPGLGGSGMVLYDDSGYEVWNGFVFHEQDVTNNAAEYLGLVYGLQYAHFLGVRQLIVEGDSQLIVKQLNGEYRVKNENLRAYFDTAVHVAESMDYFEIRHIPRAENERADWLANKAMDSKTAEGFDGFQLSSI